MVRSPLVGTGLKPLMSASTVSVDVQANWVFWLQSILCGLAETLPLTGATATVVLAVAALNRCAPPPSSCDPRGQSLVTCFPEEISTITRWFAATATAPDHSSLPYLVTIN